MKKIFLLLPISLIIATTLFFASINLNAIYGQQNQTSSQNNQTMQQSGNQTSDLKVEALLKISNNAVIALEDKNDTAVAQNLVQFQNYIINATGMQVIKIPADAVISK